MWPYTCGHYQCGICSLPTHQCSHSQCLEMSSFHHSDKTHPHILLEFILITCIHTYIHIGCTYSTLISLPPWCAGTVSIWIQTLPSILTETISTHSYYDNGHKYMHVHAVSYTFSACLSCPGNITCALSWLCTDAIFTGRATYRCVAGSAIPALHTCTCSWGCACPSIGTCVVADSCAVLDVYYSYTT